MISTHRCRRCGHVLGSFVEFVPGLALHQTRHDVDAQLRAARQLHEDRCPGRQKAPEPKAPPPAQAEPVRARKPAFPLTWRRRAAGC